MRCEHCHTIVMGRDSRTVLNDSESLAITVWRCSSCRQLTEEIHILLRHGEEQPRRIRYAVAPQGSARRLVPFAQHQGDTLFAHDTRTLDTTGRSR